MSLQVAAKKAKRGKAKEDQQAMLDVPKTIVFAANSEDALVCKAWHKGLMHQASVVGCQVKKRVFC